MKAKTLAFKTCKEVKSPRYKHFLIENIEPEYNLVYPKSVLLFVGKNDLIGMIS